MPHTLSCQEAGNGDCSFVARGRDKREVVSKMINHMRSNHSEAFEEAPEEEIREMLHSTVKESTVKNTASNRNHLFNLF